MNFLSDVSTFALIWFHYQILQFKFIWSSLVRPEALSTVSKNRSFFTANTHKHTHRFFCSLFTVFDFVSFLPHNPPVQKTTKSDFDERPSHSSPCSLYLCYFSTFETLIFFYSSSPAFLCTWITRAQLQPRFVSTLPPACQPAGQSLPCQPNNPQFIQPKVCPSLRHERSQRHHTFRCPSGQLLQKTILAEDHRRPEHTRSVRT